MRRYKWRSDMMFGLIAHGALIGTMLGLSTSPIVGVVVPLVLGIGGLRFLEKGSTDTTDGPSPTGAINGGALAMWSFSVLVSLFVAIDIRESGLPWDRATTPPSIVALLDLKAIPANNRVEAIVAARYMDKLDVSDEDRRLLAASLSQSPQETAQLLPALSSLFAASPSPASQRQSVGLYGVRLER